MQAPHPRRTPRETSYTLETRSASKKGRASSSPGGVSDEDDFVDDFVDEEDHSVSALGDGRLRRGTTYLDDDEDRQ